MLWLAMSRTASSIDSAWTPRSTSVDSIACAVPADTLTTTHGIGPHLDDHDYQALWFHLAVHDPRTTRAWTEGIDPANGLCALHDPGIGTAWIGRDGTARHTGDPALLDHLGELTTAWTDTGRPAINDWTCTLDETGPDDHPIHTPAGWHLDL